MEENRQLLVVSNNDQYREWVACLAAEGWAAHHASSVVEGLPPVAGTWAVIILDIPASPAGSLADLIEKYPRAVFVPVVAKDDMEAALRCFRAGCFDVLVEPVDSRQLKEMTARLVALGKKGGFANRNQMARANKDLKESLKILELDQMAGRQVQLSMLPDRKMRYGEYEIAYEIVPSLFLSGDFVGYNVVFDRYLLFYLADVSGHGASSAFITILLRFLLGRIVRRHINNNDREALSRAPEGFLEHINRQILALSVDKHLTIFSASIDMHNNILRYSVGAHVPTPIFMAEGDARFLPGKGKPVGIFEDAAWEVQEIALPKKFIMTATSDGVLEFVKGETMSEKLSTMIEVVAQSDYSLENICDRFGIKEVVDAPDDVTVLTVRRGF